MTKDLWSRTFIEEYLGSPYHPCVPFGRELMHVTAQPSSRMSCNWNQKSWHSCCLSPPKPITRDRDWIFMGALFRWPVIWENGRSCTLKDHLMFHFKQSLFIMRRKVECREKVNQIKAAAVFHLLASGSLSVFWAVDVSPWSTMAQMTSWLLEIPLGKKVELHVVFWSQGGSYLQFLKLYLLHALITRLINYYLKLLSSPIITTTEYEELPRENGKLKTVCEA